MKKIFPLLLISLFLSSFAFASDEHLGFRGPLNFFQSKVLEKIITTQIKKVINGDVKTNVKSYGAKALRNGIFKTAYINGENLKFKDIQISNFTAKTITENNRLDISNKKSPKLITDIQAEYKTTLSNDDIETILNSYIFKQELDKINSNFIPLAKIEDVKIHMADNRLKFKIYVNSGVLNTNFSLAGSTSIYSHNGNAEFRDIKFSKKIKLGLSNSIIDTINRLNPINIAIKELDNAYLDIKVNDIKIVDDKIQIFGIINVYRGA